MRIHWFSPLPPAQTEVAAHGVRVLEALHTRAEVVLWTDQEQWGPALTRYGAVRRYHRDEPPAGDDEADDISVYNLGNHAGHHGAIWQASRRRPGIVVLHDLNLQCLFHALFRADEDQAGYRALLQRYHGPDSGRFADQFWQHRLSLEFMEEHFPLVPAAVESALAVVVHTRAGFELLARARRWPVLRADLPYPAGPAPARPVVGGPPYRLIVLGHLGPNRRLESLLLALALCPGRAQFRLDVYGTLCDPDWLPAMIRALALQDLVTFHGFVGAAELEAALAAAHLAINLRFPTMGEASASQLRIWEHALPSLVTGVGWYAEQPPSTAAQVRPECEVADLLGHLRAFLAEPARYAELGANGRRLLEERHAPHRYAEALLDLAGRLLCRRDRHGAA
jgi:glycosyltransferase involved in cell wall biosynthesis